LKENVHVGYTRKPFGVNGQLKLQIEPTYLSDALKAEVLFVDVPQIFFLQQQKKPP